MGKERNPVTIRRAKQNIPVCSPSYTAGLDAEAVRLRHLCGLTNTPVESPTKTEGQIIREKCLTFFNLIFVVLAVLLMLVGSFGDMLFLGIAIANTAIGIFQEIRSKRTIDKLTLMNARKVPTTRDGKKILVPSDQLVRDDIVEFAAGDQICADAVVRIGQLQVNESLITGEEDAILKHPGDELLSGSFVVSGRCKAQLTKVGAESYAARLTLEAKKDVKAGASEMMAALDKVIRVIGILMVPLGVALFFKQYRVLEMGLQASVKATVAALIGMIPEGLYLLTSVALAVSVLRLARKRVLTQDMNCIENLARVDVLCVDKTGTITEAVMEAGDPILLAGDEYPLPDVTKILSALFHAAPPDNDTGRAMAERFRAEVPWTVQKVIPFSSASKWIGAVFEAQGAYLAGAPEFIMGARYDEVAEEVREWSLRGYRVLMLAAYDGIPEPEALRKEAVTPLALVPLTNRIRPEAPETFRFFTQQGVAVKVISGDNPVTVSEVARQAGIPNADLYVDARELKEDEDYGEAAEHYAVFGRVTPDQKRKLIRALKAAGHTVAMTGDGVNDVLALKDADCGVAMASGSDAACGLRLLHHARGGGGGSPGHQQHSARRVPVLREEYLFLPDHGDLPVCGHALSPGSPAPERDQRPDHRRSRLFPGAGAQPRPGQGQIHHQRAAAGAARRHHRCGADSADRGIYRGLRLPHRAALYHERRGHGGDRPQSAVPVRPAHRGVEALGVDPGHGSGGAVRLYGAVAGLRLHRAHSGNGTGAGGADDLLLPGHADGAEGI